MIWIAATNVDVDGRLPFIVEDPVYEIDKLNEAIAYFVPIEFDEACINVLGPIGDDIALIRHWQEGNVVNRKQECVIGHVVVDLDFPLKFLDPQINGEHTRSSEFFATKIYRTYK